MKQFIDLPRILSGICLYVCNDGDTIAELRDNLLDYNQQIETIQAKADAEKRDLTEDEEKQMNALFDSFEATEEEIKRRERIQAQHERLAKAQPRKTDPNDIDPQNSGQQSQQGQGRRQAHLSAQFEDKGKGGFRSFGEFATSVLIASSKTGKTDPRLIANAPTTVSQEDVGADGGFAVPPDFRQSIMEKVMAETSLISRTDQLQTASNSVTFPKDEVTPWDTTNGVQVYWEGENNQLSQSKIQLTSEQIKLNKLTALVPVTEELLQDAPTLDSYLRTKVPEKMDFAINDAIINGTGVGKPKGILNSACLITQAKDTAISPNQATSTILYSNIVGMWSRLYGPCRPNAVWIVNQDIEPQLYQMAFDPNATSKVPVYLPPGGVSGSPYGTLLGRPVIQSQACQTLGTKGDIYLVDLTRYLTLTKTGGGGLRTDVSMHLWFDYDTLAYRFIFRVGGQPWWASTISPKNGSNTLSCFVTLAARS